MERSHDKDMVCFIIFLVKGIDRWNIIKAPMGELVNKTYI